MSRYNLPLSLIPKHLGGTKPHPLSMMPSEYYEAKRRERQGRRDARADYRIQRQAEDRQRRYQLEDERRAFEYDQQAADAELGRQLALQDAETAGRLELQGRDAGSRYDLQLLEGAQALERGQQGFGFQQALAGQGFGYDRALADQRLEGQIDLASLAADLQADRDERQFGYQLAGKEFDVLAQSDRDVRQAVIQNWLGDELYGRIGDRDKELFSQNLNMAKIREGWDTIRDFREHGWDLDKDKSLHENAKEMMGLQAQWQLKAKTAEDNLRRQGVLTDQFFQTRYAEMAMNQEKVRRGITMLSDGDQEDLRSLRSAYSKELRNNNHDAMQKSQAIAQIVDRMASIYESAQPVPAELQAVKREEDLRAAFGDGADALIGLPVYKTPDGDYQAPRGVTIPDPGAEAERAAKARSDRAKIESEFQGDVEDLRRYLEGLKKWSGRGDEEVEVPKYTDDEIESLIERRMAPKAKALGIPWEFRNLDSVRPQWDQPPTINQGGGSLGPGGEVTPIEPSGGAWPPEAGIQVDQSAGEPEEVQAARKTLQMPQYMGSWSPTSIQTQATPDMIREAKDVIAEWEETGSTKRQKQQATRVAAWERQLPRFKSDADVDAAMRDGRLVSGQAFIGPDGKRYRLP